MIIVTGLFLFGLAVGSFINALMWRLKNGEKVFAAGKIDKSRSICEHCHHKLAATDLVPVISWIALQGKCRYCKAKISLIHPVFELLMASFFVISYLAWPTSISSVEQLVQFGVWLFLLAGLLGLAVYDIKYLEIDNKVIYVLIGVAMAWRLAQALIFEAGASAMKEMTLGIVVGGGFFLGLFYLSKGRWIGGGDVKLGFMYGAWLGPVYSLVAMVIAFYSAFLAVVPLMLVKKMGRKQPLPFGPFLIAGVIIATLWGGDLVSWFDKLVGLN